MSSFKTLVKAGIEEFYGSFANDKIIRTAQKNITQQTYNVAEKATKGLAKKDYIADKIKNSYRQNLQGDFRKAAKVAKDGISQEEYQHLENQFFSELGSLDRAIDPEVVASTQDRVLGKTLALPEGKSNRLFYREQMQDIFGKDYNISDAEIDNLSSRMGWNGPEDSKAYFDNLRTQQTFNSIKFNNSVTDYLETDAKLTGIGNRIEQSRIEATAGDYGAINDYMPTKAELDAKYAATKEKELAAAQAGDREILNNGGPLKSNTDIGQKIQSTNNPTEIKQMYGVVKQNERMAYESEMQATEAALVEQRKMTEKEVAKDQMHRINQEKARRIEAAKRAAVNEYNYDSIENQKYFNINDNAPWAAPMKIALGTAVTGAALCAALSSSRGQQNNAQLYGQQPLY